MNQIQLFFRELGRLSILDWAILLNAFAIHNLKAIPWFLTLLLAALILSIILKQAKWGQLKTEKLLFLMTPFFLGLIGLLVSENQNKGLEEVSRLLPFLIYPIVFNFWKTKNTKFFIRLAIGVFTTSLFLLLGVNFYESLMLYFQTGKTYHFFYTHFVKDINIVSLFILFMLLVMIEYFLKSNWKINRVFQIVLPFLLLLISLIMLEGRIVIAGFWAALIFMFFYYNKAIKRWFIVPILAISIGVFFLPSFNSRFSKISDNLISESVVEENSTQSEAMIDLSISEPTKANQYADSQFNKEFNLKLFQPFIVWILCVLATLIILLYYFSPARILVFGLMIYATLSLVAHFSDPADGSYLKAKELVAKQDAGELFTKSNVASEKYRLNALIVSMELIQEKPFVGYGTGDWRDAMTLRYLENDMISNFIEQTAPHNQYLRTWLRHGVIGWMVFITYLFFLARLAFRNKQPGRLSFVLCLILCSIGYDIFDVGGSIPFIAFFSSLLFKNECLT